MKYVTLLDEYIVIFYSLSFCLPHISMSYYDSTDKRISHNTRNDEYRSYCRYCFVICFIHTGKGSVLMSSLKNKGKQLFHSLSKTELSQYGCTNRYHRLLDKGKSH